VINIKINWLDILDIIKTNLLMFIVLFIITKALGKKQISQLTFFNYVTGITIGSIAANGVNVRNDAIYDNYISLACFAVLTFIISFLSFKSVSLKNIFEGEPTIIIKKAKYKKALQSLNLTIADVLMLLRNKNVFNIKDAYYAILEPNGKISLLKDVSTQEATKRDLNIEVSNKPYLPTIIIIDDNLLRNNLEELDIQEKWVLDEIKKQGFKDYHEILYTQIQEDGSLYIDKGD
jgi:uncharacterized membrane protein YcaP (DUF421 family)